MSKQNCLIIFTRKPELGKVKTRLAQGIGKEKALEIYNILLKRTAVTTQKADAEKQVWYTNSIQNNDYWDDSIFRKYKQAEGDLGSKMKYAFNYNFQRGFEKVVIIGTDLYDIDDRLISEAFNQLKDKDVVIGPAKDGGYYLLGMNHFIPEVFENINWSTSEVFQQTLDRISKKSVAILEEKNDIDFKEDALEHEELKQLINS